MSHYLLFGVSLRVSIKLESTDSMALGQGRELDVAKVQAWQDGHA